LRMQVSGIQHSDATGKVDEFAPFDVHYHAVTGTLGKDRMDLPHTTRNGGDTALHQGLVGLAHGFLGWPLNRAGDRYGCKGQAQRHRREPFGLLYAAVRDIARLVEGGFRTARLAVRLTR